MFTRFQCPLTWHTLFNTVLITMFTESTWHISRRPLQPSSTPRQNYVAVYLLHQWVAHTVEVCLHQLRFCENTTHWQWADGLLLMVIAQFSFKAVLFFIRFFFFLLYRVVCISTYCIQDHSFVFCNFLLVVCGLSSQMTAVVTATVASKEWCEAFLSICLLPFIW